MNIFILICNICIPLIMIWIGILYRYNSSKKINKTLDLIAPIAMLFSGISHDKKCSNNKNILISVNKKCSLIWSISGFSTLFICLILLILNKSDINNISIILLEIECFIFVIIYLTVEHLLKTKFYKKN
ncbi:MULTISPECIES: hypothetical protein [Clostridium]|uniref:Uncharacterized protein n=1 Tax=Clostridium aquiflavi TaxID=3073603 RepID=A0ABU1EGY1_9CLOT|nr:MULTISPECIES: hypothetical protein [unclassified Clostridium]MDR5587652.1 hypothetical protein [Clostridium sp. 5N-1]NFQ08576.1 hypothetical protein [Clostridium botulinum]